MNAYRHAQRQRLHMPHPALRWEDGIPLGNGKLGCLIWGDGAPLRLHLDRYDLWDERDAPETREPGFTYRNLIRLVRSGNAADFAEHNRLFDDCYQRVTPVKLPAGALELRFPEGVTVRECRLDYATAEAAILLSDGGQVRAFAHAGDGLGYLKVTGTLPEITVSNPAYEQKPAGETGLDEAMCPAGALQKLGYADAETVRGENRLISEQRTADSLRFAIAAEWRKTATGWECCFTLASDRDEPDYLRRAEERVRAGLKTGYERAIVPHRDWWKAFFSRSAIRIPDAKMENLYAFSNYLLGSSAAIPTYPMPLQGLWTADNGNLPPWKGDYHHDLNTQMTYWSYLKANHLREGRVFCDYLFQLLPTAREFAKNFFGCRRGALLPAVSSFAGKPLGGWPQYALNVVNNIWLCQAFDHYALYSGDETFLRERAYPYFLETAEAVCELLEDHDGILRLPLSSSPEVYDNLPRAYQEPETNNDLALLHYLFETLISYSERLGLDAGRWREIRGRLEDIAVSEETGVRMSRTEDLPETHRHLGHLMCFYPLRTISALHNRELLEQSVRTLEKLGHGLWVGFSFVWMANLYVLLGNGEGAHWQLRTFAETCVGENGFHLNGDQPGCGVTFYHYHPFTLEGNFGYADALQEMMLSCSDGVLRVFPALPEAWRQQGCEFAGLLSYGGVEVSASIRAGKVQRIALRCERENSVRVQNVFGTDRLILSDRKGSREILVPVGETFETGPFRSVRIRPAGDASSGKP